MSYMLLIYLIEMLNGVCMLFSLLGIVCFVVSIIVGVIILLSDEYEENRKWYIRCKTHIKHIVISAFVLSMIAIIIPTTKTGYMMLGVNITEQFVNNNSDEVTKIKKIINKKLDSYLEETK